MGDIEIHDWVAAALAPEVPRIFSKVASLTLQVNRQLEFTALLHTI